MNIGRLSLDLIFACGLVAFALGFIFYILLNSDEFGISIERMHPFMSYVISFMRTLLVLYTLIIEKT